MTKVVLPGVTVTTRPWACPVVRIVTVTLRPAARSPEAGEMVSSPLVPPEVSAAVHETGPPTAVRVIVAPRPGLTRKEPPAGETARVPGVGGGAGDEVGPGVAGAGALVLGPGVG